MQVSIYLDNQLISKIDREAHRRKQTRSGFIQGLLKTFLLPRTKERSPWKKAFGMFQKDLPAANELIQLIRHSRQNRRWL